MEVTPTEIDLMSQQNLSQRPKAHTAKRASATPPQRIAQHSFGSRSGSDETIQRLELDPFITRHCTFHLTPFRYPKDSMVNIPDILERVGKALPDRKRVSGTQKTNVKMVPTGEIRVEAILDTYVNDGKVNPNKNNLAGKKIVLLFGRQSHTLTRTFLVPKMALIYHHMTLPKGATDNIEFLYVSLDETKAQFDNFTKSHRKYRVCERIASVDLCPSFV